MSDQVKTGQPAETPVDFFLRNLGTTLEHSFPSLWIDVSPLELRYVAEALAQFAMEPTYVGGDNTRKRVPTLEEIFHQFMIQRRLPADPTMLELYGAAIWLENGFFSHMQRSRRRAHPPRLFTNIGRHVLLRAANEYHFSDKKYALTLAGNRFETWQFVCAELRVNLVQGTRILSSLEQIIKEREQQTIIH